MITESNEDLDKMVKYLDSKIIELRTRYPNSKLLKEARVFYSTIIEPWMWDFQLNGEEVEDEYDEQMKNLILEWISKINNVLKK